MSKNPINKKIVPKIIKISQAIEGYTETNTQTVKKAQALREKYGIKVSIRR